MKEDKNPNIKQNSILSLKLKRPKQISHSYRSISRLKKTNEVQNILNSIVTGSAKKTTKAKIQRSKVQNGNLRRIQQQPA